MKHLIRLISGFRRSLFLKVFSLSAVVSLLLISAIGTTLYNRLEDGIYKDKIASAISEGRAAIQFAKYRFTIESLNAKPNFRSLAEEVVKSTNVSAAESGREVVLINTKGLKLKGVPSNLTSNFLKPESIPKSLREVTLTSEELTWERGTLSYINKSLIFQSLVNMRCIWPMTSYPKNEA
ncbi:MAG: hypothetical protein RLY74_357 [Actinomycetota bacterium]